MNTTQAKAATTATQGVEIGICQEIDIDAVSGEGEAIFATTDKKARKAYFCLYDDDIPSGLNEGDAIVRNSSGSCRIIPKANVSDEAVALARRNIRTEFPPEVVLEAAALGKAEVATNAINNDGADARLDWTHLPFVTIDPASAKDHDDAIYVEKITNSASKHIGWRIYVAIADVSAFVKPGTPIDAEARLRGNSTYFPKRVVPMLPEIISNDKCSLKDNAVRPVLAAVMEFDRKGIKTSHEFKRAKIMVRYGWSYEQAQEYFDAAKPGRKAKPNAKRRHALAQTIYSAWLCLNEATEKRGPLQIETDERIYEFDAAGNVSGSSIKEPLNAHKLIEEFMVQANVAAAETLLEHNEPALFRCHAEPEARKVAEMRGFLQGWGLSVGNDAEQSLEQRHFNKLLGATKIGDALLSDLVLRAQSTAEYAPANEGHYGLALAAYAHFTSPIRRYADIVVHRALIKCLDLGYDKNEGAESYADLLELGRHLSEVERASMHAEREVTDKYAVRLTTGKRLTGRISGVIEGGLFIMVDGTGADGMVPTRLLKNGDWMVFNEKRKTLTGERSGKGWQLGDQVEVTVADINHVAGGLILRMATPGRKMKKR